VIAQLERIREQLAHGSRGWHELVGRLSAQQWETRPVPGEWSVAECVAHLNLTARAFIPLLDDALARPSAAAPGGGRARMDFTGWFIWLMTALRVPVKTKEPFVPKTVPPRASALTEFDALQAEIALRLTRAHGRDLTGRRIVSPFDPRLRYNVYAALRLIAEHQDLHLRQAARAAARIGLGG
jgi:hypothetical protein